MFQRINKMWLAIFILAYLVTTVGAILASINLEWSINVHYLVGIGFYKVLLSTLTSLQSASLVLIVGVLSGPSIADAIVQIKVEAARRIGQRTKIS